MKNTKIVRRNAQIQALRALAALLVILYHAKFLPGGYIGVDIFYVISGFLITGLILRELEEKNDFSFHDSMRADLNVYFQPPSP